MNIQELTQLMINNGIEENEAKYGLNPMKIYQYDFSGSSPTFIKKR